MHAATDLSRQISTFDNVAGSGNVFLYIWRIKYQNCNKNARKTAGISNYTEHSIRVGISISTGFNLLFQVCTEIRDRVRIGLKGGRGQDTGRHDQHFWRIKKTRRKQLHKLYYN